MALMPIDSLASRFVHGAVAGAIALVFLNACTGMELPVGSTEEAEPYAQLVYPPPPAKARFIHEATIRGSADVVAETGGDRFRQFATGYGRRSEAFGKPFGLVARNGRLFVSDTVRRLVHVLDRASGGYHQIGADGPGRLTKPLGLAVDDSGTVYVCDITTQRVLTYGVGGEFLQAIGGPMHLKLPSSVAVTPDGSRIFVLDTGGVDSRQHRIVVFDASGRRVRTIGTRGSGAGQFNLPLSIERAPGGKLLVVDSGNFRVQTLTAGGRALSAFGRPGRYPGQFGHPKDLALDGSGNIYVTDSNFGVFQIFNPPGRILLSIGERNEQGGSGRFLLPAGIDVDFDGRVYVVDQYFRKIEVFRPAGLPASAAPGGRGAEYAEELVTLRPKSRGADW